MVAKAFRNRRVATVFPRAEANNASVSIGPEYSATPQGHPPRPARSYATATRRRSAISLVVGIGILHNRHVP